MSMVEVDHGGIVKKQVLNKDYLSSIGNSEINIDQSDLTADHGGIIASPATQNYNNIEKAEPYDSVPVKFVPPLPSNLIVDRGGIIQPRTIVNDEQ